MPFAVIKNVWSGMQRINELDAMTLLTCPIVLVIEYEQHRYASRSAVLAMEKCRRHYDGRFGGTQTK